MWIVPKHVIHNTWSDTCVYLRTIATYSLPVVSSLVCSPRIDARWLACPSLAHCHTQISTTPARRQLWYWLLIRWWLHEIAGTSSGDVRFFNHVHLTLAPGVWHITQTCIHILLQNLHMLGIDCNLSLVIQLTWAFYNASQYIPFRQKEKNCIIKGNFWHVIFSSSTDATSLIPWQLKQFA